MSYDPKRDDQADAWRALHKDLGGDEPRRLRMPSARKLRHLALATGALVVNAATGDQENITASSIVNYVYSIRETPTIAVATPATARGFSSARAFAMSGKFLLSTSGVSASTNATVSRLSEVASASTIGWIAPWPSPWSLVRAAFALALVGSPLSRTSAIRRSAR